jgi:hypothetical protein
VGVRFAFIETEEEDARNDDLTDLIQEYVFMRMCACKIGSIPD